MTEVLGDYSSQACGAFGDQRCVDAADQYMNTSNRGIPNVALRLFNRDLAGHRGCPVRVDAFVVGNVASFSCGSYMLVSSHTSVYIIHDSATLLLAANWRASLVQQQMQQQGPVLAAIICKS